MKPRRRHFARFRAELLKKYCSRHHELRDFRQILDAVVARVLQWADTHGGTSDLSNNKTASHFVAEAKWEAEFTVVALLLSRAIAARNCGADTELFNTPAGDNI